MSTESLKPLESRYILDMRVDATSYSDAVDRVLRWAERGESRYVCCANVHSVMESFDAPEFRTCMNSADLVTSDGVPLVWALRRLGVASATRVYGPDLMPSVLRAADREGLRVGFYGGNPEALKLLAGLTNRDYPGLVGYSFSPPFRELTPEEDQMIVDRINASGVQIVFVGLGCPKQEKWMAAHKERVRAVMLGVGTDFDYLTGVEARTHSWLRNVGLKWPPRRFIESKSSWRRHIEYSRRFLAHFAAQLMTVRHSSIETSV